MKTLLILSISLYMTAMLQAQVSKTVNVTAGNLKTVLTTDELNTVTNLTLTGTINASDFKTMRDNMPNLTEIDLSGVTVTAYGGLEGTEPVPKDYPGNTIPDYAFYDQTTFKSKKGLQTVVLPNSVSSIGNYSFYKCSGLTSLSFPPSIVSVGYMSFYGCTGFTSVLIGANVNSIGDYAFCESGGVFTVNLENTRFSALEGVLFNKEKTVLIQCPVSKTGTYDIPATVTSIGNGAFWGCTFTSIITHALVPIDLNFSSNVFKSVDKTTCILYVPVGTKNLYATASQWKDFANIIELSTEFQLSSTVLNLEAAAGSNATVNISVNGYVVWTAVSDQAWITVNPDSGKDNSIITFTAGGNSSRVSRKAQVTVSATGINPQIIYITQEGINSPVDVTAGGLKTSLTADELANITKLTLTGTIDARDFKTMRDNMPMLTEIDLSGVTVVEYSGTEGTYDGNATYPKDAVPGRAFWYEWPKKGIFTSIILPQSITSLGNAAFWGCSELASFVIPSYVTNIGEAAFAECIRLSSMTIPSSVTTIGGWAFQQCIALNSIEIPSSVTSIENNSFLGCTALISVNSDNPNYSSLEGVFFNKEQSRLIYFPGSKTGEYIIPASVTTIEENAFVSSSIISVTIPASVVTIKRWAFQQCYDLTSINIQRSNPVDLSNSTEVFVRTNISTCILNVPYGSKTAYQAANQWKDFKNIVEAKEGFNLSVNEINIAAAAGSTATTNVTSNVVWTASSDQSWLKINPDSGQDTLEITMTAEANLTSKMRIAKVTFSAIGIDSQTITVTQEGLPLAVTAGNLKTLYTAEELRSITKLTLTGTIDARDFRTMNYQMPLLAEIDLSGVKIVAYSGTEGPAPYITEYLANAVPDYAFFNTNIYQGKISLQNIILPSTVTSIGEIAFEGCSNLTSINIPPSVKSIGQSAFMLCSSLPNINIPSSLITIGANAFWYVNGPFNVDPENPNYSSLDGVLLNKTKTNIIQCPGSQTGSYIIPSTVNLINQGAFIRCEKLTSVTIPPSVISIGNSAFGYCNALDSIEIPSSVTMIGKDVFFYSTALINVNANNTNYSSNEGVLFNKEQTKLIHCPESKTGDYIIPSSVNSVEELAFFNCFKLSTITIPSTVKYLGNYTFADCSALISITTNRSIPLALSSTPEIFRNVNKTNCILYVPYGSKTAYQSADQWKDFINIVEMPGFLLSQKTLDIAAKQNSTATLSITSNVNWTITTDQTWLTIDFDSGNGNQTLTFIAKGNTDATVRTAKVTVSSDGVESQTISVTQAINQVSKTLVAGSLKTALTPEELATAIKLTLTGTIDARDFKTMRDDMPLLAEIDLSGVTVSSYTGNDGTWWDSSIPTLYPANAIPANAFYTDGKGGKIRLISFVFPKTISSIGINAFNNCANLTSVLIPSTITDIGGSSFSGCFFPEINIPSSVISIGTGAFGSSGYFDVESGNQNYTSADGVLFNKTKTSILQCPTSITGSYIIPSSVTVVEEFAFYWRQKLTSVTIPSSVISIGSNAFSYCENLKYINCYTSLPVDLSLSANIFEAIDKTICTLKVPFGTKALYAAADQWKDFKNIVEMPGFLLSAETIDIPAKQGSTASLDISSNTYWVVATDQPWLNINSTSGNGNQTLTFTVEGNPVNAVRTATVTVSAQGVEPQTITVNQDGWLVAVNDFAENQSHLKCYPNPFKSVTTISWKIDEFSHVTLKVFDITGRTVATLIDEQRPQGKYETQFNAGTLPTGIYICHLKAGEFSQTRKMILME